MDSFDYDSLERYIRKFKRNIINKLENTNFSEKDLKNQSDLLCMVLDYSPKVYDEKKFIKKIEIKPSAFLLEDYAEKNNIRSLILEKQVSNDENSFDSSADKDQTIKLSRLSSKICNRDSNSILSKTPNKENIIYINVKAIVKEIITSALQLVENPANLELKLSSRGTSSNTDSLKESNIEIQHEKHKINYESIPVKSVKSDKIMENHEETFTMNKNNEPSLKEEKHYNTPKDDNQVAVYENDDKFQEKAKSQSENKFLEDDEEEEMFRQYQNRRQNQDERRNSDYMNNMNHTISHSKFTNKLTGILTLKVYILTSGSYLKFQVSYTDTIKDLKSKIYKSLEKDSRYKLNYRSLDAYELRIVDDDSDEISSKFEMPALADKLNVCKTGYDTMAFVEKNIANIDSESLNTNILGSTTNNLETKVTLKVHFRFEKDGNKYTIIQENGERTLKNILEKLSSKNKINYKNLDLYYFIEHSENQKEELDDMDNAINMETQLKYLNNYELDLYFKRFPDAPESSSIISSFLSSGLNKYDYSNTYNQKIIKKDNEDQGREFLFNDRTAGAYQEFEVIKINKYKSKQERILGIDMYNLYNDLPKNNAQPNLLKNIFFGGTKKPLRRIRDIVNCGYLSNKMFFIEVKNNEGKNKQIIYEVKNVNIRNEIVAKVKYLIVRLIRSIKALSNH